MFRGVVYETAYVDYFNLGRSAINITSLARWDQQKRRFAGDVSSPLHRDPKWRYRVGIDLRNENWAIRESFTGVAPPLEALNLRREAGFAEITSFNSGRWGWATGMELSHRDTAVSMKNPQGLPSCFLKVYNLSSLLGSSTSFGECLSEG
jgi:hypothetical protein